MTWIENVACSISHHKEGFCGGGESSPHSNIRRIGWVVGVGWGSISHHKEGFDVGEIG